jgi:hypothetical protein
MQTYTQCRLRRGRTEQIAWIPSEFAKKNQFFADQERRRLARNRDWRPDARKLCDYTQARLSRSVPQHRAACLKITEWATWKGASFLKLVYVGSNPISVASLSSLTRSTLES